MKNCKINCLLIVLSLSFEACLSNVIETFSTGMCEEVEAGRVEFFPVDGDCTRYVQCFNGRGTIMQCDDDLWWHQEILACDYPGDYCVMGTPTTSAGTTSVETDPRCTDDATHYLPHPAFCNMYVECFNGFSYDMSCPESLYFSTLTQGCVNAEDSECCADSDQC